MSHRISSAVIQQIIFLAQSGCSIRSIASKLDISRNTVRYYLRYPPRAAPVYDQRLRWAESINWQQILALRHEGMPLKQIHHQYAAMSVSYYAFCRFLRQRLAPSPQQTLVDKHEAGQQVQLGFTNGLMVHEQGKQKWQDTWLFWAILPVSGFTFARFTRQQDMATFIALHESMWTYFNGVCPYVVLGPFINSHDYSNIYHPDNSKLYCTYAHHTGFAALPLSAQCKIAKNSPLKPLSDLENHLSHRLACNAPLDLLELNFHLSAALADFNHQPSPDHGFSPTQLFASESKYLRSLPRQRFVCPL